MTPSRLSHLETYLASGRAPAAALDMTGTDGFLTALSFAGTSGGWPERYWGGGAPVFADSREERLVTLDLVLGHNRLALASLKPNWVPAPAIAADEQGVQDVRSWCRGFVRGMESNIAAWEPALDYASRAMRRIAALCPDEDGRNMLGDPMDAEAGRLASQAWLEFTNDLAEIWSVMRRQRIRLPLEPRPAAVASRAA